MAKKPASSPILSLGEADFAHRKIKATQRGDISNRVRRLNKEKIPRPPFEYESFAKWRDTKKSLHIEIGCGVGFHPLFVARTNPHIQILAIERTQEKFDKFQARVKNHSKIKNLFAAHADASHLLPHLLSSTEPTVDAYYILYPNPYPKAKHKNLRFAFNPLSQFLAETLKLSGEITIATNIKNYADELRAEWPRHLPLELISDTELTWPPANIIPSLLVTPTLPSLSHQPRSHFEKKYLSRGETCYNLVFRRG